MAKTNEISVDLKVYQGISTSSESNHKYETSPAIQRLLTALKYYTSLLATNNIAKFCDFIDNTYKSQILDDYYYLTKYYQDKLQEIKNLASKQYQLSTDCDLSKCGFSNRHFRTSTTSISDSDSKYNNMYIETMDSLHFYLYHLVESGLRQDGSITTTESKQTDDDADDPYFDGDLKKMNELMRSSRNATNRFSRLNGNKFNITIVNDSNDANQTMNDIQNNDTFLDHLYSYLEQQMQQHKVYDDINTSEKDQDQDQDTFKEDDNEFADENDDLFDQEDFDGDDDWGSDDNEDLEPKQERPFTYEYNTKDIQKLIEYFIKHDYDTESIDIDVTMFIDSGGANVSSNIWLSDIPNRVMMNELINIFKECKSVSLCFRPFLSETFSMRIIFR